ncbi:hypothetical protein CH333_05720 [candidate division WOR-3 bacterium JGI_Cruoil_03_44_89]|uniref:Uncharacterized protein n=1 Tax=candidate division WOR-3 bacterium JGI_Cruoil_03_44_89 TaxID=1973748 RepID=A0A235BTA5_UNCW3|nr:MAG: hypothetical protein CH333_05720 [candidate division WOR-3 bacterium JGI_Cruoil_03_44_89]
MPLIFSSFITSFLILWDREKGFPHLVQIYTPLPQYKLYTINTKKSSFLSEYPTRYSSIIKSSRIIGGKYICGVLPFFYLLIANAEGKVRLR